MLILFKLTEGKQVALNPSFVTSVEEGDKYETNSNNTRPCSIVSYCPDINSRIIEYVVDLDIENVTQRINFATSVQERAKK